MRKTNKKISRRDALKAGGVAAGGLLAAGCGNGDPYQLVKPSVPGAQNWYKGEEKWVASTCGQCHAGCGIRVRVVEGRAVKIEGNRDHPVNEGGLGPKGESGLQLLYHPDRIRQPLRRDGPRGSGKWKEIAWEEAIGAVAAQLRPVREKGSPQGLVVLDGEPRGMMPQLWGRFLDAWGSPNHVQHRATTDGGKVLAMLYMHGVAELPAYDWDKTRYVLGFGTSLLESWCQSMHLMRAAGNLHHDIPGRRVKFVQVSPTYSVTSAKADEWIPIEPGAYGALALGLANVLIRENLYDKAFVGAHTFGFEDWKDSRGVRHRGFRDLVLRDYPLEKVSEVTGIKEETIVRLAHEMAQNQPAVSLADGGAAAASNGLGTAMAIHALNALLGNLERPGGMLVQPKAPLTAWKGFQPDALARAGRSAPRVDGAGGARCPLGTGRVQELPAAILAQDPYPVQALFLYRSNPVFAKPDGERWVHALEKVPLVVSFSPLPDESTLWADFVLPDHTYLERWEVVEPVPNAGFPILGLRQPVVPPLYGTMATGDVLIRLAKELGGPLAEAFPWETYRAAMEERLEGVFETHAGSTTGETLSKFVRSLQKSGGWWEKGAKFEQWKTAFHTPSGKFEFYSQEIASRLARRPGAKVADEQCLPHWEPPQYAGEAKDFPFTLVPYRGVEYAEGGVRHLPWLRERPLIGRWSWKERIELNPEDASRLGLAEGDQARVETPAGRRVLTVITAHGVRPGTAVLPLGLGPWPADPSDRRPGGWGLLVNHADPLAGIFALQGTRARIQKEAV